MRPTFRTLAAYLEPGTPTGITGLWTHKTPRSTLLYLYNITLQRLQSIPETSLYRQSVEAVTRHRMGLVEKIVPPGHEKWAENARELIRKNPDQFHAVSAIVDGSPVNSSTLGDRIFVVGSRHEAGDTGLQDWDGEYVGGELEGLQTAKKRKDQVVWAKLGSLDDHERIDWEDEPQLTAEQIEELEHQLGGGLIEEVIEVAEGELQLIETMEKAKVWDDLEEKPSDGQWEYFKRLSM